MGPRQTIGCAGSIRNPIDITTTPCADERLDALAIARRRPLPDESHHEGLARAIDVGVEQADPGALAGPGERQIGGDRRLADATLA